MTKPYPKECRDDVVRVARNREPGVELSQIAEDFGIHFTTLHSWMKEADIEDGERPGTAAVQSAELREAKNRIKTLNKKSRSCGGPRPPSPRPIYQEDELPARPRPRRRWIPVTVTCRVLKIAPALLPLAHEPDHRYGT